jgi:hypothetical protein
MKRFHLVIGLMATLLMTKQAGALNENVAWTALKQTYATGPGSTLWNSDSTINAGVGHARGNGHHTAIEVHQGGQDGGGALWYTMATAK